MCNEKQSIKRRYGIGTGKECRINVQTLNSLRGKVDQSNENIDSESNDDDDDEDDEVASVSRNRKYTGKSKWSHCMSREESENEIDEVCEKLQQDMNKQLVKSSYRRAYQKRNKNAIKDEDYLNETPDHGINFGADIDTATATKPQPKKKFVPPKLVKNIKALTCDDTNKWNDFTVGTIDNSSLLYLDSQYQQTRMSHTTNPENSHTNTNHTEETKKYTKWGQFLDSKEFATNETKTYIVNTDMETQKRVSKEKLNDMFSMCDDNELDDVLNL